MSSQQPIPSSVLAAPGGGVSSRREAADPLVEFVSVEKSYDGDVLAVANLSLTIPKGEFLTLLGPSGSGKTTTLMMLAGFEAPTSGDIRLAGRSVKTIPPHRRNIGMVFQNYALFPHMSVAENIAFPLSVRRLSRADIRDRVARVLSLVRLAAFEERRPAKLSGGQQQRVALARALVFDPDLVLMDEPLGALDKQLREQMQLEIKRIHADLHVTVVYVTHDQSEALTMSDRIAVFKDGMVQQVATPMELYERPGNAFVAQFIGESNNLDGRVVAREGEYCTVESEAGLRIRALTVNIEAVGARTRLSIRPERIIIQEGGDPLENRVEARIEELIYHGDHVRVRLRIPGSDEFVLKVPNTRGDLNLREQQEVVVGWRAQDCRALDAAR